MKNLLRLSLVLTLLAGLAGGAGAQISIGQNDMPHSGDTLRYSEASITNTQIDLTQTGANQTWHYDSLVPIRQGVDQYKSAGQISPIYSLYFLGQNAYGLKRADSTGAGPVTVTDLYQFFNLSSSGFSAIGQGFTFQGFPVPAKYADKDEIFQLPLNYQDRDSSTFRIKFDLTGIGTLVQEGYRINTVDGWGSITTPYGTFQAVRVRTLVEETDSLMAPQLPVPITFTTRTITYSWLAAGVRFPVLEVTANEDFGTETVTGIRYRDIYRVIVEAPPYPDFFAFNQNPSVGDSVAIINLTSPPFGVSFQWSLSPATGWAWAATTNGNFANPLVKFTAAGRYSVTLAATNSGGTVDTTKVDYFIVEDPNAVAKSLGSIGGRFYPNPAQDMGVLHLPAGQWNARLRDASGRQVRTWERLNGGLAPMSLSGVPNGLYLLEVRGSRGSFVEKVTVGK